MKLPEAICSTFSNCSLSVLSFCDYVWKEHRTAFVVTTAVIAAVKLHHAVKRRNLRKEWDSAGENVVVLHTISRATTCPNPSPFVLKLETYLRMAGIQYKNDLVQPFGSKGKFPWITINGEDYTDTELIIEFLGKKFNKNFSSHLNDEQKAIARAMLIMNDEHIYWGMIWWRFVKDPDYRICDLMKAPFARRMGFKYYLRHCLIPKMMWAQLIGRHREDEIEEMIRKDIEALSLYLGKQKFLMGDAPCEVDCAIFGLLSQFVWGTPGSPFAAMLQSDYRNLQNYCFRMKEKFWPDWEKILLV